MYEANTKVRRTNKSISFTIPVQETNKITTLLPSDLSPAYSQPPV
uniref:Uncharacterized protein n=1 Tax=Arundo donax TaxID=35708 RepID=A0A0A9B6I7_ARUDO